MPPADITNQDRQHAYRQLAEQLHKLGKSAAQADDMAKKVELAAYNKAANQAHYNQLWQTSLRKAQTAIQNAQAAQQQQQAQQTQLAAQQQAQLAAQAHQQQAQAQFAAQQQQHQQQAQAQVAAQQQAQQLQQHAQAQLAAHQQAQRAALLQRQRQQQTAQHQAQLQQVQGQQYAAQQGAMPAPQQQYLGAPQQQQQAPQQLQYMQVPPQQAQQGLQFVRQPVAQQQPMQFAQVQQPGGQPQYMQVHAQPQQQYAPQAAGGHAMAPQYMQQPRAVQQGAPGSLQAQVAHVQQQQQYPQPAAMGVPQHMAGRMQPAGAPQGGMPAAPAMHQQPGMDQGFPAPAAGSMMPHAMPYDAQQARQALPAASTTASSAPAPGAGAPRRQLMHEEGPLQEFLRMHAIFNDPRSKAHSIREAEGMIRMYADLAKRDPSQATRLNNRIQRHEVVLQLLKSDRPTEEVPIKEAVKQAVASFFAELKGFREHMKRNAARVAAVQQAGAAPVVGVGGPTAGSPASTPASAGYLAMMDSDKLDGSVGTAKMPSGGGSLPAPGSQLPPGAKPAPGRPPAAPGSAASVAAEAARQQALARQRQAAGAEQQRRAAAAAVPAGPPLPSDPMQRLLAVAQQPCSQGEATAVRSGFQRLQRALQHEEQRQLAAHVADVPTPPLPPEAQRLVARERAALEAAAAAAGAAACSPGARGVVSAPSGQGFVAVKQEPAAAAVGAVAVKHEPGAAAVGAVAVKQEPGAAAAVKIEDQPPAKRARSASPDPFLAAGAPAAVAADAGGGAGGAAGAQQVQRQRSELERRVVSECEEAAAALGSALAIRTGPDSQESGCVAVACLSAAAQQQARASGVKHSWQLLTLRVPPGYPEQPPTAVFPRISRGAAGAAQAAAAAMQAQLADAAAESFVSRVAALPPPHRLLPLAQSWLEATSEVAARLAARQAALE